MRSRAAAAGLSRPVAPRPAAASSNQGAQPVADAGQTGQGQRVGERVCPCRDVRLEQLGQRVHAVAGDQLRRTADQQVRVQDRDAGDQGLVAEGLLEAARSATLRTAFLVASLPVPAVVGTATNGTDGPR